MFDDLASTFYNNVVASYEEYAHQRNDSAGGRDRHLRTAVAAATAIYHFREHLPDELRVILKGFETTSADYALLRGVANATKHKEVTSKKALVARAEDIRESIVNVEYVDKDGAYFHSQTAINVTCTDGTTRWLDIAITRVLNILGEMLREAHVCDYTPRREPEEAGSRYLTRGEASVRFGLEMLRSIEFRQSIQFMRFDPLMGRAIPQDVSGSNVSFKIYERAKHVMDITMSRADEEDALLSIPLSGAENATFEALKSDLDLKHFQERFIAEHKAQIEQWIRALFGK
jgi:hypothetical protein